MCPIVSNNNAQTEKLAKWLANKFKQLPFGKYVKTRYSLWKVSKNAHLTETSLDVMYVASQHHTDDPFYIKITVILS
jgi:hypothetical protein